MGWRLLFDHESLSYMEIPRATTALGEFHRRALEYVEDELNIPLFYETNLADLLDQYHLEVGLLNAPIGLLLLQIGALVLFFLIVTVALVRRGERREIAMMQSRGAFDLQVVLMRVVEGLAICVFAAIIAPFLARQFLISVAPLVTNVDNLPLVLDAVPFVYAGVAGLLAMLVLVGTLRPVLRLPLILAGGSAIRGDKQSWWQRYYLDVVLLVVGAGALLRLVSTNSALTSTVMGGAQADPLLLLAPAIMFVALGSISLRLFPAFAESTARFFSSRRGLTGALATWQVSREPAHYGRITFLLALAVGVGWFATSFQATLSRSQIDQARYAAGTDVRFREFNAATNVDRALGFSEYEAIDGVADVSVGLRYDGINLSQNTTGIQAGTLLAVDPSSFGGAHYWREDLGAIPLPVAAGEPGTSQLAGEQLPFSPSRVGFWVKAEARHMMEMVDGNPIFDYYPLIDFPILFLGFHVRFRDSEGTYLEVFVRPIEIEGAPTVSSVGDLQMQQFENTPTDIERTAEIERIRRLRVNATGWIYFEGSVPETLVGDVWIDSIYFTAFELSPFMMEFFSVEPPTDDPYRRVTLSELTVSAADGRVVMTDILNRDWDIADGSGHGSGGLALVPNLDARSGGQQFGWAQFQPNDIFGFVVNYPVPEPIPALVSAPFAEANNMLPGVNFDLFVERERLTFQMVEAVNYFPTVYADRAPFVIADVDALLYMLNRRAGPAYYSSEVWLRLEEGISSDVFLDMQRQTMADDDRIVENPFTLDQALDGLQTDPLSLGLIGLLFVAFAVALTLSVVSLLTYTALTVQARRNEFAVLRALGMSSTRLVLSIATEQILVFATAILLGGVLGVILSRQVLPSLAVNSLGQAITPPFLVEVELGALMQYGAILVVMLGIVLLSSLALVRRLSLAQALRFGEE
jgi:hypothetical protein